MTETNNTGYTVTVNGSDAADGNVTGILTEDEPVTLAFNNDKQKPPVIITPSTTSVTVKKTWKLDDGRKTADSVEIALLKNGTEEKTVILNEENNWTYTWEGLPLGSVWTVKELDVPEGFDSTIQQVGTTYTIINDDQPTKPDDPAKPDKPTKPDKPSKPAKPNKPADPNHSMVPDDGLIPGGAGSHGAPQTGDTANAGLWLAGMGLSAAGLAALFFARRKKPGKNAD